jgi:hypothetical protein
VRLGHVFIDQTIASATKIIKYREHLLGVDILANIDLRIALLKKAIETKGFTNQKA